MKNKSGSASHATLSATSQLKTRPLPPVRIMSATSEGEPFSAEEDDERAELARLRPKSPKTFGLFTSSRAKLNPFELESDPTIAWAYRPSVLTCLGALAACVVLFAYHTENLVIPTRVKKQSGLITAVVGFLLVSIINFRDGPYKRPHPAFWRAVLGTNVLYCMTLAYLLWQDDVHGREFIQWFDPSLIHPADEKSYGQNCAFTATNLYNGLDHFALAHVLGWYGKAVILRDFWACTILSVMFEITEISLSHQIENFNECWWDRWILDISVCNLGGTLLGLLTCHYLDVTPFSWRGDRNRRFGRMFEPLTPHEWTKFQWKGTERFRNYLSVITLLATFLLSELNVFYLKTLLWLPAEHPIVIIRLAAVFAWALPATAEFYHYVTYSKRVKRMGSHAVMLLTTVCLESLIVLKWSTGKFPNPAPTSVKIFWSLFVSALVAYPVFHFGLYKCDRRQSGRNTPVTFEDGQTSKGKTKCLKNA